MRLFGLGREPRVIEEEADHPVVRVPEGMRVYAIGDVHGRFDLLRDLLGRIETDDAARGEAETHVVLLGDLIDRGPQSAEIIEFFLDGGPGFARFHFVMGNHEEMMLRQIDAPEAGGLAHFLRYGGRETFESYGVPQLMLDLPERYEPGALAGHVPARHREFLRAMRHGVQVGDYLFVHAGIRPGVAIDDQTERDLRWIRSDFLDSDADHGVVVVHGHSIAHEPELRANRIGIDTGAYSTGVLTALGLERDERWLLATAGEEAR